MIAGVGGVAISGLGNDKAPPSAGHQTTSPGDTGSDANAPLAGQTTALGVGATQDKCAAPTPEILAQYPQAFQGTVTSIEDDTVTIETTEVLNGEVGETVEVTAPQSEFDAMIGAVNFQVGESYLVAAYRRPALDVLLPDRRTEVSGRPSRRRSSTEHSRTTSRCRGRLPHGPAQGAGARR